MCSGYKTNKNGYGYCNHGFIAIPVCKINNGTITPFCTREESHVSVLPDNFDIMEYRERMENIRPNVREK
jgi:hypothetical protein